MLEIVMDIAFIIFNLAIIIYILRDWRNNR